MHYGAIKTTDIANGNGIRTSLFVSGCRHRCKNCFNPETWDFFYGEPFTEKEVELILNSLRPDYIEGLSLLGGDPCERENQEALLPLLRRLKREMPDKTVWCYTGYLYEDFAEGGRAACAATPEFLGYIDILVDGPFIEAQKNLRLRFRGSENQRVIDVKKTRESGKITIWDKL